MKAKSFLLERNFQLLKQKFGEIILEINDAYTIIVNVLFVKKKKTIGHANSQ